ncbi:MAG: trypsin-like peptidase domain-containing protein [Oscillospiraceae bacterium]|nr:trypsin-like peptidase domain-containing protein [Oscillospiraceae bacterium]
MFEIYENRENREYRENYENRENYEKNDFSDIKGGFCTNPETAAEKPAAEVYLADDRPYYPVSGNIQKPVRRIAKTSPRRMRVYAALIAVCMIGSAAFGFVGANLMNYQNNADISGAAEFPAGENKDLIPSALKTAEDGAVREKMSVEDVIAGVQSSVVEITTEVVVNDIWMRQFVSGGAGSGVIISEDGYIVTNSHVIKDARLIKVRLSDEREYSAELIGADPNNDLALIKIEAENLHPAVFGKSSGLLVGQTAIAIGNPLGELGGTVTSGIISALDREITIDGQTMSLLQTDTAINPGNSGGGLFNLYGELIGIVNAKSSGFEIEGLGFAIPIDAAKIVIDQIINNGFAENKNNGDETKEYYSRYF